MECLHKCRRVSLVYRCLLGFRKRIWKMLSTAKQKMVDVHHGSDNHMINVKNIYF